MFTRSRGKQLQILFDLATWRVITRGSRSGNTIPSTPIHAHWAHTRWLFFFFPSLRTLGARFDAGLWRVAR